MGKRHRRNALFSKTVKIYGGVTLACFLVGAIVFLLSEQAPQFLQERVSDTVASQAEQVLGRKLTGQDAALIEKRFGIKVNLSGGTGPGGAGGDVSTAQGISPRGEDTGASESPKGKVFKEKELMEMVDRYAGGKVDPSVIDQAKRALREQR